MYFGSLTSKRGFRVETKDSALAWPAAAKQGAGLAELASISYLYRIKWPRRLAGTFSFHMVFIVGSFVPLDPAAKTFPESLCVHLGPSL